MNAIGEFDLELLEDYLDDALSPVQVEHVARRLAEEPELALAMHELRASRLLRAAVWRSLEPSEAAAAAAAGRVAGVVRDDLRRRTVRRSLWLSSGIAAAVALFIVGWFVRIPTRPVAPPASGAIAHSTSPAPATPQAALVYHVTLVDQHGRLLPVQKFSKADDARQFARDLLRYEDRRHEAEQGSAMLVSDHF